MSVGSRVNNGQLFGDLAHCFISEFEVLFLGYLSESSSVGRAPPCQGGCREFESRLSLQITLLKRRVFFLPQTAFLVNAC